MRNTEGRAPLYQVKADLFRSLGHPVRIRVLELLAERDHAVHELLAAIQVEQSGLSQHLAVLRRSGLVRQRRIGGAVIYSLVSSEVRDLLASARRLITQLLGDRLELIEAIEAEDGRP